MHSNLRSAVEVLVGAHVRTADLVVGGFTTAECWSIGLDDGRNVFAKFAIDEEATSGNRIEAQVLSAGHGMAPTLIGISDDGAVLVTEDLSAADWTPERFDGGFWDAVAAVGDSDVPNGLFQTFQGAGREWWSTVAPDDRFAGAVGVDPGWLAAHAPALSDVSRDADTSGISLLRGDLGPGNWCWQWGRGWRFVDWSSAHRGNPMVDDAIAAVRASRVSGLPVASARLRRRPEFVAFVGGRFASELLDADWTGAPVQARVDRVDDIRAALVLASALLGIPSPNWTSDGSEAAGR